MTLPVWESPSTIGTYPAQVSMVYRLSATVDSPYEIVEYVLISGSLPNGLSFRKDGKISGTPNTVSTDTTSTFVVRVYASDGTSTIFADKTFAITITGAAIPKFTLSSKSALKSTQDSTWYEVPVQYTNPIESNPVIIRVLEGSLPPGLEINTAGLIRGYADIPVYEATYTQVETFASSTSATTNYITVQSTANFEVNRPIKFGVDTNGVAVNDILGGLTRGKIYYVSSIINSTQFTITTVVDGPALILTTSSGLMNVILPGITPQSIDRITYPISKQYNFTLDLISPKGNDRAEYSITVYNQNLSLGEGGLGTPVGCRNPVILNTRPAVYNIEADTTNYGYYVLPPSKFSKNIPSLSKSFDISGLTYDPNQQAYIGEFQSDNYFSFHLLGKDFDNKTLTYTVSQLPAWATFDPTTGWIYGNPIVGVDDIEQFSFIARVSKTLGGNLYKSDDFNFIFKISNGINGDVEWLTDSDLGILYNSAISYQNIEAISDVSLQYELVPNSTEPPPNLTLKLDGHLEGIVAYQPVDIFLEKDTKTVFDFTIRAYNPDILKLVTPAYFVTNVRYFIYQLGNNDWLSLGATETNAGSFVFGKNYLINKTGNTDFTFIGAVEVFAPDLVIGKEYIIKSLGTTDFTTAGAPSNTVDTIFTATNSATGFGTVYETFFTSTGVGSGTGTAIDEIFIATGAGSGSATGSANTYMVTSDKTFSLAVLQYYDTPTDNLYIKCTPDSADRDIINALLSDTYLIPEKYIYRPDDKNFGKAKDVTYAHAYGIHSNGLDAYIAAVEKNHYWRDLTLGEINTAVARDANNNILYEVVYSNIIDNLLVYDPEYGVDYRYTKSVPEIIYWPRFIDLNLGPWYTSSSEIYTSYIFNQEAQIITNLREFTILTQNGIPILMNGGIPTFYTSLTPGYARILYPNSTDDMRLRVEQELGVNSNFNILPKWMTSQQLDGNTLGFTPAWVICYTKPATTTTVTSYQTIANKTLGIYAVILDSVTDLVVDRPITFIGNTFGNIVSGQVYYVKSIGVPGNPNAVVLSATKGGVVYQVFEETSTTAMVGEFDPISYAGIIKERLTNWTYDLNQIDFKIDRFTVDKQLTYDYITKVEPKVWAEFPSATPTPDPLDSKNFYVLFPRKTILPTKTQYNL